jgi:hypothetical protein
MKRLFVALIGLSKPVYWRHDSPQSSTDTLFCVQA